MDSLKDTGNVLTYGNAALTVGIAIYFYNQNKILREELLKLGEQVAQVSKAAGISMRDSKGKGDAILAVSQKIKDIENEMEMFMESMKSQDFHDQYIEPKQREKKHKRERNINSALKEIEKFPPHRKENRSENKFKAESKNNMDILNEF